MKKLIFALIFTTQIQAALPPLYQSLNEYKALLGNPALAEKLTSADLIESIELKEGGFLIKTNKHTLKVDLVYDPQGMPGPQKFHLVFQEPTPL